MNKSNVDSYLIDGCGRCSLAGTINCKVNRWNQELKILRSIIIDCGLKEELKWGVPCYSFQGKNVLILAAFKNYCAISFFKGALLSNSDNILSLPSENTNATRIIKFTSIQDIVNIDTMLKSTIFEAIEIEKLGSKIPPKPISEIVVPAELQKLFDKKENQYIKQAFESLTSGRKKGYILYFNSAKQSKTIVSRIEKCIPQILKGKGLNE